TDIQKKDKNEAKTDKTEHEIGKGAKSQSQSQKVKVKNSKPKRSQISPEHAIGKSIKI
ncbi:hypothetical protein Tco_1333945, partial [Tanacetum coccineum]